MGGRKLPGSAGRWLWTATPFSSHGIILIAAFTAVLISMNYVAREGLERYEYYVLMLFCTFGMMLMASAQELIMIFLALETMSIPVYVLAGWRKGRLSSHEAALKYLLLGAFSSAFLLYGIALIYGARGHHVPGRDR